MGRYLAALGVAAAYTALACWVVGREGQAHRDALRARALAGPARVAAPPTPPRPVPAQTTAAAPSPAPTPAREDSGAKPPPAPGPVEPPRPAPAPAPVAVAARTPEPKAPEPSPAPNVPSPSPARVPSASPWADTLDLARLSAEDERRLGAELHALILATNPVSDDGDAHRRAVLASRAVWATLGRGGGGEGPVVTVLQSDAVNAFSHPGGYVYVSRGLFDLIGTADEGALQFVLAHEIAHLELKHALRCVAPGQSAAKSQGIDTLRQFLVPIGLGYPDAMEFEADAWAYRRLTGRLDRTRREALAFLRKFQGYAEARGFAPGHKPPDPRSELTLVENHYRAHPAAWDRLDRLRALDSGTAPASPSPSPNPGPTGPASPPRPR